MFSTCINIRAFQNICVKEAQSCPAHKDYYLNSNLVRLYRSYLISCQFVSPGSRVLSAGAGVAYVERVLAKLHHMHFTLLDFPDGIEACREDYSRYGFESVGVNLATEWEISPPYLFDAAFSLEVVEHLPIPPQRHFAQLIRYLKPGGLLLVNTPNLASFEKIARLALGRPILTPPEMAFAPVVSANQGVHRREYTASEIMAALMQAGVTDVRIWYTFQGLDRKGSLLRRASRMVQRVVPYWRPQLIFLASIPMR